MTDRTIPLYHGENDCQEFWEGEGMLLLRPFRTTRWSAMAKDHGSYRVLDGLASSAEGLVADLPAVTRVERDGEGFATLHSARFVLDTSKEWRRCGAGFQLASV